MQKSAATAIAAAALAFGATLLPLTPVQAQVTPNSPPPARLRRQSVRINQGLASGNLTPAQAARLHARDARIRRRARYDRAMNGGHLRPGQRARLQNRLNRTSAAIAKKKNP